MVREVRRYGRWLRDNYADLEHKEVWQSFVVLVVIMLMFGYYVSGDSGMTYEYITQVGCIVMVCVLLWRVETLSSLTPGLPGEGLPGEGLVDIELLLQKHCIDKQLYLQRDLNVNQLAQALGTNRTYLSQYFSSQNTTYNAYINKLRIDHFCRLYQEAVADEHHPTAQHLVGRCGYRSYSTFSLAFKQRMGQSVASWMRENTK
jgi:AraC-like DNA-binding protein